MNVQEAVAGIEQHLKAFAASAAEKIGQELPVIGAAAEQLAGNPAMQALASAVHLPEAPEVLASLAEQIIKIDEALGAAKAAGAASAQQAAQQPEAPAEPAQPA